MYKDWHERVQVYIVYVREAHPDNGWQMPENKKDGVVYNQPKTYEERCKVAGDCIKKLKLSAPALVDDMKDTAEKAYSAWPDRVFVVTQEGKIGYAGGRGPFGFKVGEALDYLKKNTK